MAVSTPARKRPGSAPSRPLPPAAKVAEAFDRLARQRALHTLVRGALPAAVLKRLLKDAMPRRTATEMPQEVWSSLAVGIALETPVFGVPLAQALHDRLAWDREPGSMDEWWQVVRQRPLEALWMAALSDHKAVRKEFAHIAEHCIENFRSSPECAPPSWEFVEALQEVEAQTLRQIREAEKKAEDAERRYEAERERLEELREELKRLRRETSELRAEKAQAERRAEALEQSQAQRLLFAEDTRRVEEMERRLRKAEKEREHLIRELERLQSRGPSPMQGPPPAPPAPPDPAETEEGIAAAVPSQRPLSEDPNLRRRVLRQMVRKLFKKGKIGASHTHEDNVYRGVPDHEKGIAKEAMELLYREGLLVPKRTLTDPHVSLSPDRTGEIRAIIAGDISNPRLLRFIEG